MGKRKRIQKNDAARFADGQEGLREAGMEAVVGDANGSVTAPVVKSLAGESCPILHGPLREPSG